MKKLNKKKLLIIIGSVIGCAALIFGIVRLVYSIKCNNITGVERRVMRICEQADDGLSNIKYANLLKKVNNGYKDYYYYDVVTMEGEHYIVTIRDSGKYLEYENKSSYTNFFNMYSILDALVEYRESELGSFSDSVDETLDKIRDSRFAIRNSR